MFLCDSLSGFVQAVSCPAIISQDVIAKMVTEEWVVRYGAPGRITADNNRRWTGDRGPWVDLLSTFGVEMHLSTPYQSSTNGRCERRVQELRKTLRAMALKVPSFTWGERLLLAVCILNSQPREPSGASPAEIFNGGRPQWQDNLSPHPHSGSAYGAKVAESTEALRQHLVAQREARRERGQSRQPPTIIKPGVWAFVHRRRFPSAEGEKRWLGPYLVEKSHGREAEVCVGGHRLRVHHSAMKVVPTDITPPSGAAAPEMTTEEMEDEGFYRTEAVIAHRN